MAFDLVKKFNSLDDRKKTLLVAAAGGGALGLYVLSQRGGLSGGSGSPPPGTDAGQQPGTGTGTGGTDWGQAIAQLQDALTKSNTDNANAIAELVEGQGTYQSQIASAFADITKQVNDALSASQQQVQSAIANIPAPQYGGMNGLDSLFSQFQNGIGQPLPVNPFGNPVQMPSPGNAIKPSLSSRARGILKLPVNKPSAPTLSKFNPSNYASQLSAAFGRAPKLSRPDFSSFNRAMGAIYKPTPTTPIRKVSKGGGGSVFLKK